MTHELILTSVSQGLEPDSSGFCVVAADQGIPPFLVKRLTTLSEYRHLFSPGQEESRVNPVVYSHLIAPSPEGSWHVLSRIADIGLDYRHAPNRLAHHVALREKEFVEEGPAWLLALPGFQFTEWLTPAVRFLRGRSIPTLTSPPSLTRRQRIARERLWLDPRKMALPVSPNPFEPDRDLLRDTEEQAVISGPATSPCPLWRQLTGDAGWGGILADTVRTGQQVIIPYPPGLNLLPLFVEALSLLPPPYFWKATFSTYFTRLPEHVPCQWKGVVVGSPDAESLLSNPDALILDISRPLGTPPPGPYVEFARNGLENSLPDNEESPSLFQDDEFDTHTYYLGSGESGEKSASPEAQEEQPSESPLLEPVSASDESLVPPVLPFAPPVLSGEAIHIRTKTSSPTRHVFSSILNMKSRGRFYLLYGTTLLLLLFLLMLVADQFVDFGLTRRIRGEHRTTTASAGVKLSEKTQKSPPKEGDSDRGKLDPVAVREERIRQRKEQQEQAQAERLRRQQLQREAESARAAYREKVETDARALDDFLLDFTPPSFLSLTPPKIDGNQIHIPDSPEIFDSLAPLHRFGAALELNVVPLLNVPNVRLETRKLEFFLDEKEKNDSRSDETPVDDSSDVATPSTKLGPEVGPEDVSDDESTISGENDSDLRVPDAGRFEWAVLTVDTETLAETPMLHLELLEQGLRIRWEPEGLEPRRFFDTLWNSLGFLRLSVQGEKNVTRIKSIPLFEPAVVAPLFPSERFADPDQPVFSVEMPLAREPWKTLFENSTPPPFSFRLNVRVVPEFPAGVRQVEMMEGLPPSRFYANFLTEIASRRTVAAGSDSFSPIIIPFEGEVEPGRIVWTDRFGDRIKVLREEQSSSRDRLDELKKEEEAVQKKIFNAGSGSSPELTELRKRRNELRTETRSLDSRIKEIEDILTKLPSAHQKILDNKQLRFDFSVFLVPPMPQQEDEADSASRPRNEESLLLLTTAPEKSDKNEENGAQVAEPEM